MLAASRACWLLLPTFGGFVSEFLAFGTPDGRWDIRVNTKIHEPHLRVEAKARGYK
jgi:hypothetical protein